VRILRVAAHKLGEPLDLRKASDQRDLRARIALLETALAERDAKLAERDAKLAERDAKLAEQAAKITALRSPTATSTLDQDLIRSSIPPRQKKIGA
jgi:uncharacterized coiled-coil protein SlyX